MAMIVTTNYHQVSHIKVTRQSGGNSKWLTLEFQAEDGTPLGDISVFAPYKLGVDTSNFPTVSLDYEEFVVVEDGAVVVFGSLVAE